VTVRIRVTGAEELRRAAAAIRRAGRVDLRKELLTAVRESTKPIGEAVRKGLPTYLPDNYAAVLGRALRFTTKSKTSGWPEVTVTARAKGKARPREITAINRGVLRHPLFGRRKYWYAQKVRPGFFDEPAREVLDDVRHAAAAAVDRVRDKLEREI
jgi:hypothetical protein